MARLYFNLFNSVGFVPDEEGKELPDLAAARETAVDAIRSLVADDARQGLVDLRGRIEVCDAAKEVLLVVRFAEAAELSLESAQ